MKHQTSNKNEEDKRDQFLMLVLTSREKEQIREWARRDNRTLSNFIVTSVLNYVNGINKSEDKE